MGLPSTWRGGGERRTETNANRQGESTESTEAKQVNSNQEKKEPAYEPFQASHRQRDPGGARPRRPSHLRGGGPPGGQRQHRGCLAARPAAPRGSQRRPEDRRLPQGER